MIAFNDDPRFEDWFEFRFDNEDAAVVFAFECATDPLVDKVEYLGLKVEVTLKHPGHYIGLLMTASIISRHDREVCRQMAYKVGLIMKARLGY